MTGVFKPEVLNVWAKPEVTYAVDPTVAATDAIQPKNFTWDLELGEAEKPRMGPRPRSAGKTPTVVGVKISVTFDLGGPGDPDTDPLPVPEWMQWALNCGMKITSTGSPATAHTLAYDARVAQPSLHIYCDYYEEGAKNVRRAKFAGARFTMEQSVEQAGVFEIKFEGLALWVDDEDVTGVADSVFAAGLDEIDDAAAGKALTFTLNTFPMDVKSFKYKSNRSVSFVKSMLAAYGNSRVTVDSKPGAVHQIDFDRVLEAVADDQADYFAQWLAAQKTALSLVIDTSNGCRVTITAAAVQEGAYKYAADEGIFRVAQTVYPTDTTAQGDTSITWTIARAS